MTNRIETVSWGAWPETVLMTIRQPDQMFAIGSPACDHSKSCIGDVENCTTTALGNMIVIVHHVCSKCHQEFELAYVRKVTGGALPN